MAIIIGTNASQTISGTNQGDIIITANGNDTVNGGNGSDIITGGNGNDVLNGGGGSDIIDGGNGNDTINGNAGSDILLGGNGDDTLDGGSGSDILTGGAGNDTLIYRASENAGAADIYDGGTGTDTLRLIVSQTVANSAAFQADIAALQAKLAHGSTSYIFKSFNLIATSIEKLQITIEGGTANHAPVAIADTVGATEDVALTILASSLLVNDTDVDSGDSKTLVSVQNAAHGTVALDSNGNVVFAADTNYSGVASFTYTMKDAAGATSTATVTVNVAAVADAPTLTVNSTTGNEDNAIALSISAALTDTDGSEHLSSLVVSAIPIGAVLADGAGHTFAATADHTSVDVNGWSLPGLTITPPANSDADFALTVTATSQEGASGPTTSTTAILNVTVNPVADAPTLTVSDAAGNEDTAIPLAVSPALTDTDGSEHLSVTISDIPSGATLSDGVNSFTAGALTEVSVSGWDLAHLTVTPPANSGVDFALTVTATSQEGASGPTTSTTATLNVTVNPVADAPAIAAAPVSAVASDGAIPLDISVALTDTDGSETLGTNVTIDGVPSGFVLNHGAQVGDGGPWLVALADLPDLALMPAAGTPTPGSFTLHISATSTDGPSTATGQADLNVTLTAGATQTSGRVVDGYIAGATVFADANGNGVLDAGEVFATTNADGTFTLTGGSGPLVMTGGTDISTGLAFTGTMKAPAGSTVVTPLTTLVAALVAADPDHTSIADAQDAVKSGLGLSADVDLTTFDAVAEVAAGNSDAANVLAAAVQVQTTVAQISAVAGTGADVTAAVASLVAGASGPVNLSDTATVTAIATQSGVSSTAVGAVAEVVADANSTIATAIANSSATPTDVLTGLAQAATVALGATTQALANTDFSNLDSVADLTTNYTGDALAAQVAAAPVAVVTAPTIGTLGNDTLTGTSGADAIDGLDGNDTLSGLAGNDLLFGGAGNDVLFGGAGDDKLDGGAGVDLAKYASASGPITVDMAAGSVAGDSSVGHDILASIERVSGTAFDDTYVATGFNGASAAAGSPQFNEFEGLGGNDTIVGNGSTRASYLNAAAGVTVDLAAGTGYGTAAGDAAGVGTDTFSGVNAVRGSNFDDVILGSGNGLNNFETFEGRGGNDFIDGRGGLDRVNYANDPTAAGISVSLAVGTVTGDAAIGTDTLRSIESVRGTNFADTFDATGFGASSTNAGSNGAFNEFEGMGGNDTVTGNGRTRVIYVNAGAGVTVDLAAGTASGTAPGDVAGIGTDTFTGANTGGLTHGIAAVRGSNFADILLGSNTANNVNETFEGFGGDDLIDGRGGFDTARYDNVSSGAAFDTLGIQVALAAGTVTGRDALTQSLVGTDTLRGIEGIRGTNADDVYDATGFGASSTNVGSNGTLNQFEGLGGDDTVSGNGNTRVSYQNASAGVTVTFTSGGVGTATGTDPGDLAGIGTDTFLGGVNQIRGSQFADVLNGSGGAETLDGQGGNDTINGGGGNDILIGGGGDDTIDGGTGGIDIAQFTGARGDYTITSGGVPGSSTVADSVAGRDGTDTLTNVELTEFSNTYVLNQRTLNISNFNGLTAGKQILGTNGDASGVGDTLTVGLNANGHAIDLAGGGTDTLVLAAAGTYSLSVAHTEVITATSGGAEQLTLLNPLTGTSIDLGSGVDTLHLTGGNTVTVQNVESVFGGADFDTVTLGAPGSTAIDGVESVIGSGGDDTVILNADPGVTAVDASFDLGAGNDTVVLDVFGSPTINLGLNNVESVTSTGGAETVNMMNAINGTSIDLGAGFDTLNLGNGDNTVTVSNVEAINAFGDGNDNVTAILDPNVVNQSINLGAGTDTLTFAGTNGDFSISVAGGNLTVIGATSAVDEHINLLNVQAGTTFDLGAGGNDSLNLSWDFDPTHVNVVSVRNVENVVGSGGSDQIHILGNGGGTTAVTGGAGADLMWASADADRFVYSTTADSPASLDANGRDTIFGFDTDHDVLDLRGLNVTNWTTADAGGQTIVDVFVDGHTQPDLEIALSGSIGTHPLDGADFWLA
jgi:Ca2+-binding RTX toxin-like protein